MKGRKNKLKQKKKKEKLWGECEKDLFSFWISQVID